MSGCNAEYIEGKDMVKLIKKNIPPILCQRTAESKLMISPIINPYNSYDKNQLIVMIWSSPILTEIGKKAEKNGTVLTAMNAPNTNPAGIIIRARSAFQVDQKPTGTLA